MPNQTIQGACDLDAWTVFENLPSGLVIIDQMRHIRYLNNEAAYLIGDEQNSLLGTLFPWPFVDGETTEFSQPGTDGSHPIEISAARQDHDATRYHTLLLRRADDRPQQLERLEQLNAHFKAILRANPLPMLRTRPLQADQRLIWPRGRRQDIVRGRQPPAGRTLQRRYPVSNRRG